MVLFYATGADAGALGSVVSGTRAASGGGRGGGSGGGGSGGGGSGGGGGGGGHVYDSGHARGRVFGSASSEAWVYAAHAGVSPPGGAPPRLELYGGLQSVHDSDVSGSLRARASVSWLGFEAAHTSFFERTNVATDGKESESGVLALHTLSGSVRVRLAGGSEPAIGRPALYATAGMAGLWTVGVSLMGLHTGLDGRLPIADRLHLLGEASVVQYQHGITSVSTRVGVAVDGFRLSYRVTDLNTGPPLHGPELGYEWRY